MQLVTVGTYDNLIEAELAKLQLESACIDAVLKDAEMVHLMPIYTSHYRRDKTPSETS